VLVQECEQVNVLIGTIKSTLEDLLKGCRGELGVTDAMEKLQASLNTGKVPAIWQKYAYDTAKALVSW
jgi:dynein heavy chain